MVRRNMTSPSPEPASDSSFIVFLHLEDVGHTFLGNFLDFQRTPTYIPEDGKFQYNVPAPSNTNTDEVCKIAKNKLLLNLKLLLPELQCGSDIL
jgi:hypothetical protein